MLTRERPADVDRLRGTISSATFASGDRFVMGCWRKSPLGRFADVMWADATGHRKLLAPSNEVADYVSSIYAFDDIQVVRFAWHADPRRLQLRAGPLRVRMSTKGGVAVPVPRPAWLTRRVETPIARRLFGVEAAGTSPLGVREVYQARSWRWVARAQASLDDQDLGALSKVMERVGVGFSEPLPRPAIVDVAVRVAWAPSESGTSR